MRNRRNLRKLSKWMFECIHKGQWPNYDLHIDEVYGKAEKKFWIKQGLRLLELSKGMVDKSKFHVVLTIPLKEVAQGTEEPVQFESLGAENLSWTPPSLNITIKNREPWMKTLSDENMIWTNGCYRVFLSRSVEDDVIYRWAYVLPVE